MIPELPPLDRELLPDADADPRRVAQLLRKLALERGMHPARVRALNRQARELEARLAA